MTTRKTIAITPKQNEMLQKAISLHQAGKLDAAEKSYKKLLSSLPSHPLLLTNLGTIALQKGFLEHGARIIGKSLAVEPNQPSALNNLGNALKTLNRLEDALESYDRAIAINPSYADAYCNRGNVLQSLKRLEDALASYDRAIALSPNHAEAYANRGAALKELSRLDDAVASYNHAIAINPNYAEAYLNRGVALQNLQRLKEALSSYDRAIAANPNYAEVYFHRGNTLKALKRLDDAVADYDRAMTVNPNYAEAYSNRGNALKDLNRLDDSLASYDRAIAINPDYPEAFYNRGNVLQDLNRLDEAVASYDRAIAINPSFDKAYSSRGFVLQALDRLDEALASYDRAITINPSCAEAYWNKSLLKLLMGDYLDGWNLYEWRLSKELSISVIRNYPQPLWLGEQSIAGRTLLIYPEQGLGDYIQFIRYTSLVEQLGGRIVLEAPSALMAIASTLKGRFSLVETGKTLPEFDFHCPIMSLPLAFKTTVESIPNQTPYLYADDNKQEEWHRRLGEKTRPRVGLVWSGSTGHKNDHNRSIPLKILETLLNQPIEFHCLQKEIRPDDAAFIAANEKISTHQELLHDFSDTAALIAVMDLVISVDTSVAHLAGAMGKEVWILLPYAPDYRWMLDRDDTPWYPSAKLFRQPAIGDWDSVIGEIELRLSIDCFQSPQA